MELLKVAIGNYRSVGEAPAKIDLQKKINVLIGANNSGKSNIISGLSLLAGWRNRKKLSDLDCHGLNHTNRLRIRLEARPDSNDYQGGLNQLGELYVEGYFWDGAFREHIDSTFDSLGNGNIAQYESIILKTQTPGMSSNPGAKKGVLSGIGVQLYHK